MIKYFVTAALVIAAPALAQSDYGTLVSAEMQAQAAESLLEAQKAATHMTNAEIRQVFKIERPVCSDAKELGIGYTDKVADHLDLSLWQGVLLTHLCIVKWYGTSEQQAALIALMGKGLKR